MNSYYPFYTENICKLFCRIEKAIELCGCRPFFYTFGKRWISCDFSSAVKVAFVSGRSRRILRYNGIVRVISLLQTRVICFYYFLRICLHRKNWTQMFYSCDCLPSCESISYSFVHQEYHESNQGSVYVSSESPITRIKRDILFDSDDLIGKWIEARNELYSLSFFSVSFGGAASLFLGCSFISIAELIFFLFQKIASTVTNRHRRVAPIE